MTTDEQALSGFRILDLTQFEAGAACTLLLAWLGADVIKIESPEGDRTRRNTPEVPGLDAMFFLLFNTSKRSVVLDLKHADGRALFLRMAEKADVVIENFAPGLMERLNLDYPVLREANRRIVLARIKGFGSTGPYSDYKSFDYIAQAVGGLMSLTGLPDGEPMRAGGAVGDSGAGVHAAVAVLAAYVQAQRTGEGQVVEVSMQEALLSFIRSRFRDHYRQGASAQRVGNERPAGEAAPAGLFPCAPGGPNDYVYIYVEPYIEQMWHAFARVIARADLLEDPRFADAPTRYRHRAEIDALTRAWTSQRTKQEVMRVLGEVGVPCGAVLDTGDVLDDPHLNARGAIVTVDHPTRGQYRMPGCPVRLSASPAVTAPAPLLGQHTDEVLAELLAPYQRPRSQTSGHAEPFPEHFSPRRTATIGDERGQDLTPRPPSRRGKGESRGRLRRPLGTSFRVGPSAELFSD